MSTLHLLRDWLLQSPTSLPVLEADSVHLGPHRLPRQSRTAWRLKKGDYLDVASVVFFINNEKLKLSEYVKACGQAGVQVIPYGERKDFQEWLKGGPDANQHIDQDVVAQQAAAANDRGTTSTPPTSHPSPTSSPSAAPAPTPRDVSVSPASSREAVVGSKRTHAMVDGSTDSGGDRQRAPIGSSVDAGAASMDGRAGSLLPPSLWQLSDVLREEVVYLNRVSCLQGSKDLSGVGAIWDSIQKARLSAEKHKREEKHRPHSKSHPTTPSSSSRGSTLSSQSPRSSSPTSSIPIILVPASLSSCISLYNAKQFLEDGLLIPTSVKRAENPTHAKPTTVRIVRPSVQDPTRTASYDVVDDTSALKGADWRRVVAVFVSGSAWQFEGWPAPFTSPAAIFAAIPAFYLSYADDVVNKNVQQWKVHPLQAHRAKNYADRGLQMEFWNLVTEHMKQQHTAKGITF